MAECREQTDGSFVITLEDIELQTLQLHASREELCITDALVDQIEFALNHKVCEICLEEKQANTDGGEGNETCVVHVTYPKQGPFAHLDMMDRQFVASTLAMSLRESLTIILWKKMPKELRNELERVDENNGSSKPVVP